MNNNTLFTVGQKYNKVFLAVEIMESLSLGYLYRKLNPLIAFQKSLKSVPPCLVPHPLRVNIPRLNLA